MTKLFSVDPGLNTGWTYGMFDEGHPYRLIDHGVIGDGDAGFLRWYKKAEWARTAEVTVSERFDIDGTITGSWSIRIEGIILALTESDQVVFQGRGDKAALLRGQTRRNEWIKDRFPGSRWMQHDLDSTTHALVYVGKRLHHMPTLEKYWARD